MRAARSGPRKRSRCRSPQYQVCSTKKLGIAPQRGHAVELVLARGLRVHDHVARVGARRHGLRVLERVEDVVDRRVAVAVDRDLESGAVQPLDPRDELLARDARVAALARVVAGRHEVRLREVARVALERAVRDELHGADAHPRIVARRREGAVHQRVAVGFARPEHEPQRQQPQPRQPTRVRAAARRLRNRSVPW